MAEVLGVADSVKGLVAIADAIVRKGFRYMTDVRGAENSVEKLVEEVKNLSGVLHSLNNVVERLEEDGGDVDPSTQIHYIESCYKTLKDIQDLFDEAVPAAPLSRRDKLKWPLKQARTQELLAEIGRHKSTMTLAMSAREMTALLEILAGQDDIRSILDGIKLNLEAGRAEREKLVLTEERQNMLKFLGGDIDVRKLQSVNIRLRQPGTGVWFTDGLEFKTWLSTDASKLWINGIPGAGKTILISSIIQEIEKNIESSHALAFFYCDYKDPQTHDPEAILGELAKQLILQNECCFDQLSEFCQEHSVNSHTVRPPTLEEVCDLIRKVSMHFQTTMVVVDGLDEITNNRADVTRALRSLNIEGGQIKTLFASRLEIDIGYELEDFVQVSIAAMSSDLRLYVASEIERRTTEKRLRIRDPSLKDHIMTTLVDGADGMFRWVSCQMDYLCECNNDRARREALKKLPPDLPSSYERILERVNRSSKENQDLVKKTLHWIVYVKEPLNTEELIQALAVDDGDRYFDSSSMTTEEDILHWCSSLVRREPYSGQLELAHFTAEEFLMAIDPAQKPSFQQYRLSGDHTVLAKACLNFILCQEFDGVPLPRKGNSMNEWVDEAYEITNNLPFADYANIQWNYHVHNSNWDNVKTDVMELFSTESAFAFWTLRWLMIQNGSDFDADLAGAEYFRQPSKPTALHWAAAFALDKACVLLNEDGMSISQQSSMGTPLYCAMVLDDSRSVIKHLERYIRDSSRNSARRSIVSKLIIAGANLNEPVDPRGHQRALTVALESEIGTDDPFIASMILDAGARLLKEDFVILRKALDHKHNRWPSPGGGPPPPSPSPRGKPESSKLELCGISAACLVNPATGTSCNLVPEAKFEFFSFALNIVSCRWPRETFEPLLNLGIPYGFPESIGSELNSILSDETKDWQSRLVDVLSKAIRNSALAHDQVISSLQQSLFYAVRTDNAPIVSLLLTYNDDLDVSHQEIESKDTLLHVALDNFSLDDSIIKVLIARGANVTCPGKNDITPIESAAELCGLATFELFWDSAERSGALDKYDEIIRRALDSSMVPNNERIMNFLAQQLLERKLMWIDSLLEFALRQEKPYLLDMLLSSKHGFDRYWYVGRYFEQKDRSENSEDETSDEGVSMERDAVEGKDGHDTDDERLESQDSDDTLTESDFETEYTKYSYCGRTLELEACYLAASSSASLFSFKHLFSRGNFSKAFYRYQSGNTMMHILARDEDKNSFFKLRYLLGLPYQSPADQDILNGDGLTPLAVAVQNANLSAMELLLREGRANPNVQLADGQTVLHLACEQGNYIAVNCLLRHGCSVLKKNRQGLTAKDVAWSLGYFDFAIQIQNEESSLAQIPRFIALPFAFYSQAQYAKLRRKRRFVAAGTSLAGQLPPSSMTTSNS